MWAKKREKEWAGQGTGVVKRPLNLVALVKTVVKDRDFRRKRKSLARLLQGPASHYQGLLHWKEPWLAPEREFSFQFLKGWLVWPWWPCSLSGPQCLCFHTDAQLDIYHAPMSIFVRFPSAGSVLEWACVHSNAIIKKWGPHASAPNPSVSVSMITNRIHASVTMAVFGP